MRMQNLSSLTFDQHLHWPQGRRRPALITIRGDETKNDAPLEFEIPTVLAERLQVYRNEIALGVTGKRPDAVFVTRVGKPRTQAAIALAIEKTVLRHLQLLSCTRKLGKDQDPRVCQDPEPRRIPSRPGSCHRASV